VFPWKNDVSDFAISCGNANLSTSFCCDIVFAWLRLVSSTQTICSEVGSRDCGWVALCDNDIIAYFHVQRVEEPIYRVLRAAVKCSVRYTNHTGQ
jgi:hypothetical protein